MECFAQTKQILEVKRNLAYDQVSTMLDELSQMLREIKDLDESSLNKLNKILQKQMKSVGL